MQIWNKPNVNFTFYLFRKSFLLGVLEKSKTFDTNKRLCCNILYVRIVIDWNLFSTHFVLKDKRLSSKVFNKSSVVLIIFKFFPFFSAKLFFVWSNTVIRNYKSSLTKKTFLPFFLIVFFHFFTHFFSFFRSFKARHCPKDDGQPPAAWERRAHQQEPPRGLGLISLNIQPGIKKRKISDYL